MASTPEIKDLVRRALIEILSEDPGILVEALFKKPEILTQALAKLAPWASLLQAVEEISRKTITREEFQRSIDRMATKQDLEAAVKDLEKKMATKQDLEAAVKDLEKKMATKQDLEKMRRFLENRLDALGARWGIVNEEAFRKGVREILEEAGYAVERWTYYDKDGYVFNRPSTIEIDVVVKDGQLILVEIASAVKRGDIWIVRRKAELYEKVEGRKASRILCISPYIDDRNPDEVILWARDVGIDIVSPERV